MGILNKAVKCGCFFNHVLYSFRSVGKTDMNEHSSRSHFVFTLRIYGVNEVTCYSFSCGKQIFFINSNQVDTFACVDRALNNKSKGF